MKELFVLTLIASLSSVLLGEVGRPVDPPTFSRRVIKSLIDSNRLQEAQEKLKDEVVARGETAETLFLEGMIRFKQKRFAESLNAAQRSLVLGLHDSEVYKLVAFNGVVLNRLNIVEPALNKALELAPSDETVHLHLGLLYFTTNRFALAEGQFREVTKLKPDYMKGYDMLGQAQEELEKVDAAFDNYRKAIELTAQQNLKDDPLICICQNFFGRRTAIRKVWRRLSEPSRSLPNRPTPLCSGEVAGQTRSTNGSCESAHSIDRDRS